MTIPMDNWCSTCQEACHDHSTICTICGSVLEAPPSSRRSSSNNNNRNIRNSDAFRLVPEFISDELRQASQQFREALLRPNDGTIAQDEWQAIPAELLEPNSTTIRDQPTSKGYLQRLPRFVLEEKSSIFRQATLEVRPGNHHNKGSPDAIVTYQLVPGEFGPTTQQQNHSSNNNLQLTDCPLVVANPRTGKGGLSKKTKEEILQKSAGELKVVVYMERGDSIPFVQKAMLAQECGAAAVVIGNSMSDPWPYVMQDSKGDAERLGLSIPVAMAKLEDGQRLVASSQGTLTCNFRFQQLSRDCAICCDLLQIAQKILQIPTCGHIFHESCALQWLTKHHTCPYCRYQLPTDDKDGNQVVRNRGDSSLEWSRYYG